MTHISGTPSHWRRALMSGCAGRIAPGYVRLSGEIADQAVLDRLQAAYPAARVAHAFASTEAGVAFDVDDGLAGFPAALVGTADSPVQLRVEDGTLRIRSSRTSRGYLGDVAPLADADGFVDTGDIVTLRGDRYFFLGRRRRRDQRGRPEGASGGSRSRAERPPRRACGPRARAGPALSPARSSRRRWW